MRRLLLLSIVVLCALPVFADDALVRFEGGIGVNPVARVDGTAATGPAVRNVVLGVPPGGFPWVINRLSGSVKDDGRIAVEGRGLLLAGGNGIGTNGGQSVRAMVFCGGVASTSSLVPLDPNGDFEIDDTLSPAPANPCTAPVLLIVNANGAWFAAGIPKH